MAVSSYAVYVQIEQVYLKEVLDRLYSLHQ